MRSRPDARRGVVLAGLLAAGAALAADQPPPSQSAAASAITVDQVRGIVAELRADPTFANRHTERRLHWIVDKASQPRPAETPAWLIELARWLSEGGRGLMWLLGAIGVAVLAVGAWRWASVRAEDLRGRSALQPSHVNDLDIRPESLPDDVAAAARALLGRGAHRAALSLLYRGALSRLVHRHGVAIRAASTEGECVRLAQRALPVEAGAFFERLVQVWQTEVYAGRATESTALAALCDAFDRHFGTPAATGALTSGPAPAHA